MKGNDKGVKSVAIIGAGAAGSITAAAFAAEQYFDRIRVFERRETAGGTWIYDPTSSSNFPIKPGQLPPSTDPPLDIPKNLPKTTAANQQERFSKTPIYSSLTTNVPSIAMSFSDVPFAYGPFVPHHIPRQYIESYIATHQIDNLFSFNTTVEDISKLPDSKIGYEKWKLTLRRHDDVLDVDEWWEEEFDAVILANGHYAVPFIPQVDGLEEYLNLFPGKVTHSKAYRSPELWRDKKVLVIGNSASGHDVTTELVSTVHLPVYQSRRSASRWDGDTPPDGIAWKPIIKSFLPSGRIIFEDVTYLDDIDTVIYCTGYLPSYPFWNEKVNGRPLWDYEKNRILKGYHHTFFQDFKTLAIVGLPRTLTFRSFEYQAIALARLWSGRNTVGLPPVEEQIRWEEDREKDRKARGVKFHDVAWEGGETFDWLDSLYRIAGLRALSGEGRTPPVLGADVRWAIEHLRKYPEPGKDPKDGKDEEKSLETNGMEGIENDEGWVLVKRGERKDLLAFI